MTTKTLRSPAPRKARTEKAIIALPYDNTGTDNWALTVSEDHVSVHGTADTGDHVYIRIDRDVFDELVDWYNTGKIPSFETRPTE